jgi:UPF0176 protein
MKNYRVLLYYCYTNLTDAEDFRNEHHQYCIEKNLLGRIIISCEGINGTICGLEADCQDYMAQLQGDSRFSHIEFKVEKTEKNVFKKLHVRFKPELVNSGLVDIMPSQHPNNYVDAKEFARLKDREDVVVLDVRSDYEYKLGKFKNSVTLPISNFREFPSHIDKLTQYKGKKIITVCTGGVKCEKASIYLKEKGFPEVYQLHGGIIRYGIDTDGKDFEGKCYVFDGRISTEINKANPSVISSCFICNETCDRVVNCANADCNRHVPICVECGQKLDGTCSKACYNNPNKRAYDGTGYYTSNMNGYNPCKGSYRKAL